MTGRAAAEIALGVAGVYLVASGLPACAVSFVFVLTESSSNSFQWLGVLGGVATCVSGGVLVGVRRALATWLVPGDAPGVGADRGGLQAAAIAVIGVLMLAHGITTLLSEELLVAGNVRHARSLDSYVDGLVRSAVGLGLFLGGRGIVGLWRALRERPKGVLDTTPGGP